MAILATAFTVADQLGVDFGGFFDGLIGGLSRSEKRKRRDKYLSALKTLGMKSNIYLKNSDNWQVLKYFYDIAEVDSRMITAINLELPSGGKLYSENSPQFARIIQKYEGLKNSGVSDQGLNSEPMKSGFGGGSIIPKAILIGGTIWALFQMGK